MKKSKLEAAAATVATVFMYGYSYVNHDWLSFCSGVFAGISTIIVAVMWHDS